jgi:hypothetical protein
MSAASATTTSAPQLGIAATGDTDDQSESAVSAGSYPRFGVLDDDTTFGPDSQSPCCLDKHRGIRLAGEAELLGKGAVNADIEQVVESRVINTSPQVRLDE